MNKEDKRDAGPLCVDCEFFVVTKLQCFHDDNVEQSLVDGKLKSLLSPSYLRGGSRRCGKAGKWHEPRHGA